jgi:hypothetical protein
MTYNPGYYPGTDTPIENVNQPPYTDPNFDAILEQLQGLIGQSLNLVPPNVMGMSPWGPEQISQFLTNRLTGARAGRIGEQYETGATDLLNRFARKELARRRTGMAETGGRGSSAEARMEAESLGEYFDARSNIGLSRIGLEEDIRGRDIGTAFQAIGGLEDIMRGDFQNALQTAMALMQQTGQEAGILGQMGGLEAMDAQMMNEFLMRLWENWRGGGVGAEGAGDYIIPMMEWAAGSGATL